MGIVLAWSTSGVSTLSKALGNKMVNLRWANIYMMAGIFSAPTTKLGQAQLPKLLSAQLGRSRSRSW